MFIKDVVRDRMEIKFPKDRDEITEFILSSDVPLTSLINHGRVCAWVSRKWEFMKDYCKALYISEAGLTIDPPRWLHDRRMNIPLPKEMRHKIENGLSQSQVIEEESH